MTITSDNAAKPIPTPCPLARDLDGYPLDVPENAIAWRVRRKTGGRPRLVLGADKQPMQLPLAYSIVDLEDVLAPAEYLLDAVDQRGESLGLTIAIAIGQFRNAGDEEVTDDAPAAMTTMLPTTGSDVRLVLEANVRATQMAFLHNQKTLELGLRMAESLRDGVRVMADSQADWIKSMASARGFFRNAPALPAPPPSPANDDEPDDDDDDDDDVVEVSPQPSWVEAVTPIITVVTQQIMQAVMSVGKKPAAAATSKFEIGDAFDWRRAAAKHEASVAPQPLDLNAVFAKLPPAMTTKLVQLQSLLTLDEQQRAMQMIQNLEPQFVDELVARAEKMTAEQFADFLRGQLAKPAA